MKYLPIEHITYKTKLSSEEVSKKIEEVIEPKKTVRINNIFKKRNHKPYEGYIHENTFNIKRIINHRNSFLPIINGTIKQNSNETTIRVKMKLHTFVIVFMSIWLGLTGIVFLLLLIKTGANFLVLVPGIMLILGYLLMIISFKWESRKTKKQLAHLFEAKIQ